MKVPRMSLDINILQIYIYILNFNNLGNKTNLIKKSYKSKILHHK